MIPWLHDTEAGNGGKTEESRINGSEMESIISVDSLAATSDAMSCQSPRVSGQHLLDVVVLADGAVRMKTPNCGC